MSWEWLTTNFLIILSVVGGIGAVVGIGWFVWWLVERRLNQKILQEMLDEIKMVRERQRDMQLSLDGIPEVRDRRKAVIYRDAFRAMREYRHTDAIAKFNEALPLASDDSERCAILNLIGMSQMDSGATRDAEQTFLEMIETAQKPGLEEPLSFAFGNIGLVYYTLGEPQKALGYYQKSLEIAKRIGNLEVQANQLGNIGNVYYTLGELRKALGYYQRAREIFVRIGAKLEVEKADQGIAIIKQKLAEQKK